MNNNYSKLNVLGKPLEECSRNPLTGWFRDGFCRTDENDSGSHVVCALITNDFLLFTKKMGNDLISKTSYFPGLKEGDYWCVCALRWLEAYNYDRKIAPKIRLESTSIAALNYIPYNVLYQYRI